MTKRPANLTSHTELSTLAQCEMKWQMRYREGIKDEAGPALILGRLIDVAAAAFWKGVDWRVPLAAEIVNQDLTELQPNLEALDEVEELELAARAYWLMLRYERHYWDELEDVTVLGQQLDLRAQIPGTKQRHQAIIDELWEVGGKRWMVERKTYGRQDSTKLVHVMPQLTLNLWVAREHYENVAGIVYDGIYTYRWKPSKPTQAELIDQAVENGLETVKFGTHLKIANLNKTQQREWAREELERSPGVDRPDEESFTMLWLDRQDDHVSAALEDVRAAVRRREALRRGSKPMRNLGPLCGNCGAQSECFSRLAFPQAIDIDLDME